MMSDDEQISREVRRADFTDEPINDACARMIAAQWHGGQATAMCSFATTGAITPALYDEVDREVHAHWNTFDGPILKALGYYIQHRGERGPVPGWSNLWLN
jgi:hypothetical protein